MNADTRDDFTCPERCLMSNLEHFANSWTVPTDTCKVPEMAPCKPHESHDHPTSHDHSHDHGDGHEHSHDDGHGHEHEHGHGHDHR